jgi:hypothetical protein
MTERDEQSFALSEIETAIEGVDDLTRGLILDSLDAQLAARKAEQDTQLFRATVTRFATIYQRTCSEEASASNYEGWYDNLGVASEELLRQAAPRTDLSVGEAAATELASLAYVYYNSEFECPLDMELLEANVTDPAQMLEDFQSATASLYTYDGMPLDEARQIAGINYPTLDSFHGRIQEGLWGQIEGMRNEEMRAALTAEGYELPELNAIGQYDDENNDED